MLGEKQATSFLKRLGFSILFHRYKTALGEIDIIAQKENVFHIIEVKKRKNSANIREAISSRQIKRIVGAAQIFIEKDSGVSECDDFDIQMDAIFIADGQLTFLEKAWTVDDIKMAL